MTEHEFKMGDDVLAWDYDEASTVRGKFISYASGTYPFYVLISIGNIEKFANCKPYKAPAVRPMTHKEVFELTREPVVFRYSTDRADGNWVINHWDNSRAIEDFEYCPIAELVEPLRESPWRKLEAEDL